MEVTKIQVLRNALLALTLSLVMGATVHFAYAADEVPARADTDSTYVEELIVTAPKDLDLTLIESETERLLNVAGAALDPLQAIFALPGVTFSIDGEPVIRGSAPQDNAYYIDLIPARDLFHTFGNSIFNEHLIRSFELYPAAFSSEFSNATGGVIDVRLRNPRNQRFTTTINGSFLIAGVLIESRITENQAFYLSYRRSLLDQFASLFIDEGDDFNIIRFPVSTDYQFKYKWHINEQHTLSVIAAGAGDVLAAELLETNEDVLRNPDLEGPLGLDDGFDSQGVIWDWVSAAERSALSVILSHTRDDVDFYYGVDQRLKIVEESYLLRVDYTQKIRERHQIKAGVNYEASRYKNDINLRVVPCTELDPGCPLEFGADFVRVNNRIGIDVSSLFAEGTLGLSDRQSLTVGLHYFNDNYLRERRLEPRARWQYDFKDKWQTYAAIGRYSQLPELEQMIVGVGNPNLTTIKADHFVWGIAHELGRGWSIKTDLYYKKLQNIVASIDPGEPDADLRYSNDAKGSAYGAEIVLNKDPTGKWYGWVALGLSKTDRTDLRSGETTPFTYDKPITLDLVLNWDLSERWMMGLKWSYYSGGLYTPIADLRRNALDPNVYEPIYGPLNSQRYPAYHRFDFRLEYKRPGKKRGHWSLFIDIINAYDRGNVLAYNFDPRTVEGHAIAVNEGLDIPPSPPGFGQYVPVTTETTLGLFPSFGFELQF